LATSARSDTTGLGGAASCQTALAQAADGQYLTTARVTVPRDNHGAQQQKAHTAPIQGTTADPLTFQSESNIVSLLSARQTEFRVTKVPKRGGPATMITGGADYHDEPLAPQRGLTRTELGRDISEAQAEAEAKTSACQRMLGSMSPKFVWSMAEGYPVVIKQFLQFCLIVIYPAWVAGVLFSMAVYGLFYITVYPILWLLFWPLRNHQKKHHPEEYAESQRKK
jgi:hypothetical protein